MTCEMHPVDCPWIMVVGCILMSLSLWDDKILILSHLMALAPDMIPSAAFDAINQNILCHPLLALAVMIYGMRIKAYVGDIEVGKQTIIFACPYNHVWQRYGTLARKTITHPYHSRIQSVQGGFSALWSHSSILLLGLFIAVFQQWCGTNVIFNYAQEVFQQAGYEIGDVLFNFVITGIANVVFTVIAIRTVDKVGRKPLMMLGAGALCIIYALLGGCYYLHVTGVGVILLVVLAIGCYAMTLGPCTWVLISEIFPDKVRSLGVATCTFALWAGSSTLTYTFPFLNKWLGSYGTFWIYAAVCAMGFMVFALKLKETKGKNLE